MSFLNDIKPFMWKPTTQLRSASIRRPRKWQSNLQSIHYLHPKGRPKKNGSILPNSYFLNSGMDFIQDWSRAHQVFYGIRTAEDYSKATCPCVEGEFYTALAPLSSSLCQLISDRSPSQQSSTFMRRAYRHSRPPAQALPRRHPIDACGG